MARGYLNRAEASAEKFVPDPFTAGGARLYRTGDRARYLADGNIEFLGRRDQQVKVRGYRIELEEIEAALIEHETVRQAVVIAREESEEEKRLVAYVVGVEVKVDELRQALRAKLPEYMVPSAFVVLDQLPLTPSGKLDRRALPAPYGLAGVEYEPPATELEEELAGLWRELLKVERVGINDNFFNLGGHSLLATRLIFRLHEHFQVELPLRALFEAPTIAMLAPVIVQGQLEQMASEEDMAQILSALQRS
jgi:acyl carrier protein